MIEDSGVLRCDTCCASSSSVFNMAVPLSSGLSSATVRTVIVHSDDVW
jgi:hypothetical protein